MALFGFGKSSKSGKSSQTSSAPKLQATRFVLPRIAKPVTAVSSNPVAANPMAKIPLNQTGLTSQKATLASTTPKLAAKIPLSRPGTQTRIVPPSQPIVRPVALESAPQPSLPAPSTFIAPPPPEPITDNLGQQPVQQPDTAPVVVTQQPAAPKQPPLPIVKSVTADAVVEPQIEAAVEFKAPKVPKAPEVSKVPAVLEVLEVAETTSENILEPQPVANFKPKLKPFMSAVALRRIRLPSSGLRRRGVADRFSAPLLPIRPYGRNLWLCLVVVTLVGAAQTALYLRPLVGVYVDAVSFAILIGLALRRERSRHFLIAVSIIPLAMLVGLSLPKTNAFQQTTNLALIFLVLGLTYQYLFTIDYPLERTRLRLTRQGYLFAIPLMVVLGQALGLLGYGLLRQQYDFRGTSLIFVALGAVVYAIAEEILFRGLIQQKAMQLCHPAIAAAVTTLLYASLTVGHRGGILTPVFGLILGAVLSVIYYRKQNILLTMTINISAKLTYIGLVAIFVLRH